MITFFSECLRPQHILHLPEEFRHWDRNCWVDPDDSCGGGHHDPGVQEEAEEPEHHWLLHLLRALHQHGLQPQQHEQVAWQYREITIPDNNT